MLFLDKLKDMNWTGYTYILWYRFRSEPETDGEVSDNARSMSPIVIDNFRFVTSCTFVFEMPLVLQV